jgi:hypothetical protein
MEDHVVGGTSYGSMIHPPNAASDEKEVDAVVHDDDWWDNVKAEVV